MNPMLAGAMSATEQRIRRFHTVADNAAATVGARWCKRMDRALETIEHMRFATHPHLETFVVDVTTDLTGGCLTSQGIVTFIHFYLFSMTFQYEQIEPS
jgi:hypothetical protein